MIKISFSDVIIMIYIFVLSNFKNLVDKMLSAEPKYLFSHFAVTVSQFSTFE